MTMNKQMALAHLEKLGAKFGVDEDGYNTADISHHPTIEAVGDLDQLREIYKAAGVRILYLPGGHRSISCVDSRD